MRRVGMMPRADRDARFRELGFEFATIDGRTYWDESAAYAFTAEEIDAIEAATGELEQMCMTAVDKVVRERLYAPFGLNEASAKLVEQSWKAGEKNLYGRFDLCVRDGAIKLYEYNADTPTALFEASVVQWDWLEGAQPKADQFNSIHEKLIEAWPKMGLPPLVHFTCVADHVEDRGTIEYLRDTATQAGLATEFLTIEQIGWNGRFVDAGDRPIDALFKLYPWEWLMAEDFGAHIAASGTRFIEPAWKMVLANKAILALLWHMYPEHPNLLAASLDAKDISGKAVAKPKLGREGADIQVLEPGASPRAGDYGQEGFVFQAHHPLPEFSGRYPVVGSWVIASQPAGIGIREDADPITRNSSAFVPHYFE